MVYGYLFRPDAQQLTLNVIGWPVVFPDGWFRNTGQCDHAGKYTHVSELKESNSNRSLNPRFPCTPKGQEVPLLGNALLIGSSATYKVGSDPGILVLTRPHVSHVDQVHRATCRSWWCSCILYRSVCFPLPPNLNSRFSIPLCKGRTIH